MKSNITGLRVLWVLGPKNKQAKKRLCRLGIHRADPYVYMWQYVICERCHEVVRKRGERGRE